LGKYASSFRTVRSFFSFIECNYIYLFRVYYRKTVPAEQPINPGSPRERSPPARRHRRPSPPPPPSPSPPPVSSRSHSHHQSSSSSRHQRPSSPPRSSRAPRRHYSPFIPLPPDLVDYVGKKPSRQQQQQRSSPSPVRRHQHKQTSKQQRSRSPNSHRSASPSSPPPAHRSNADNEFNAQQEPTRTLFVGNLERDIAESKLKEIFGRYGTIDDSKKK
jgi:hypothetical protein